MNNDIPIKMSQFWNLNVLSKVLTESYNNNRNILQIGTYQHGMYLLVNLEAKKELQKT